MSVTWTESEYDGGSPIEGYKVQWKYGAQEYSSSRQAIFTDLTDLQHNITGLAYPDVSCAVRVMAYNHNGDGADDYSAGDRYDPAAAARCAYRQ